jgi:signal transduction histidine kinase/ActR/RegA family two-component response regulator
MVAIRCESQFHYFVARAMGPEDILCCDVRIDHSRLKIGVTPRVPESSGFRSRFQADGQQNYASFAEAIRLCHNYFMLKGVFPRRYNVFPNLFFIVVLLVSFPLGYPDYALAVSNEIQVGTEIDFPPYAYLDENGQPTGFSIDLIKDVASSMGMSIKISTGTWDSVWNSLVSGRLDVLPIVAKQPGRAQLVDFSLPHTETFDAFFVRKGNPAIANIDAARGKEIVVMRSDVAHHELVARNFQGNIVLVDTISQGLALVAAGKHDAFLCSKLIGTLVIKKDGLKGLISGPPIPDYKRVFSFAVKKGDADLLEKLNQGLLIVKTSGEYDRIYEKWLTADDPWLRYQKYVAPAAAAALAVILLGATWLVMLQVLVRKRTRELMKVNLQLKDEIVRRREMEDEIMRAQKLESVGVLAGGIAHDFNNILAAVMNNISVVDMLLKTGGNSDKISRTLEAASRAVRRATTMTHQLLTFAKGGEPVRKTTYINNLIKETVDFSLRGSKVRCEFRVAYDLCPVRVDEGQIAQVISNLVINADQAMPGGGKMDISAENVTVTKDDSVPPKEGRYVKLTIRDWGVGIPKKYLTKIFDPYFTTKQKGSGLGLATSYSIVKRHEGFIAAESEPGEGTSFVVYLPVSDEKVACNVPEAEESSSGGRILVMDDDQEVRDSMAEMLQLKGYEVDFAREGAEAIKSYTEALKSDRPYVAVVMDLTVRGGMGGEEAVREIRRMDPDVKAIVASGYSNDPVMSDHEKYGFIAALAKPYDVADLSKLLQRVIADKSS